MKNWLKPISCYVFLNEKTRLLTIFTDKLVLHRKSSLFSATKISCGESHSNKLVCGLDKNLKDTVYTELNTS